MRFIKTPLLFFMILSIVSCSKDDDNVNNTDEDNTEIVNDNNSISDQILELINKHRESAGLTSLVKNETAKQLCIDHTKYMISIEKINHDNFGKRADVLKETEKANSIAENVASFYPDAQSVVAAWLNSSGHKNNIEGDYTHTGIASIKDEKGNYYYTQIFYR